MMKASRAQTRINSQLYQVDTSSACGFRGSKPAFAEPAVEALRTILRDNAQPQSPSVVDKVMATVSINRRGLVESWRGSVRTQAQPHNTPSEQPTRLRRLKKASPNLPIRVQSEACFQSASPPHSRSVIDQVIAIINQAGFTRRSTVRRLRSSPASSCPPTPGLEDSIAAALLAHHDKDAGASACTAYEAARSLKGTSDEEYLALINDMWVDPKTLLKASCLTHALMANQHTLAELLEAHGAQESYVLVPTPDELALVNKRT